MSKKSNRKRKKTNSKKRTSTVSRTRSRSTTISRTSTPSRTNKVSRSSNISRESTPSRVEKNIDIERSIQEEIIKREIPKVNIEKENKKINLVVVYFICLFYFELLYQILTFGIGNLFSVKTVYYLVFALILSLILNFFTKIFKKKTSKIILPTIILIIGIYYFASYLFKAVFNTYFSIHLLGVSDQAVAFMGTTISLILQALPVLILYIIPFLLVLLLVLKKNIHLKRSKKLFSLNIISLVISIILFILMINLNSDVKVLFYEIDNNAMNMEKLGVNISTYLDIKRIFSKVDEKLELSDIVDAPQVVENGEVVYDYNTLDIDFDSLIENESNSTVKSMHEYISKSGITLKNKYTGKYKDKNLIVFMGESLNDIAISEKYTPTLYKLAHEGMEFTNFYTPVNLSTLGGEFQNLTGLFANLSMLSGYFRKGNNYFPLGLGNVYNNLNYEVNAYHANSGYFQDRNKYLKSLGFDKFTFNGNGLESKMNCKLWPQSDLDMINVTMDDYMNSDRFMTYYVSVSGHMPWSYSGNAMSRKNKDLVKDSGYSEEAAAYIAANIELDKAVESLINKLKELDKLDDTVIAIVPDHYPYSMNINTINELSSYERDTRFEVNHSTLILYNSLDEHEVIDKVSTQLDFIPTLYNLFGIDYDSRLFMGKDILSTSDGLAYFSDRSWISDKGRYVSANGKFTPNEGVEVESDYVSNMNKIVSSRINMSKLIMEQDYYRKVLK